MRPFILILDWILVKKQSRKDEIAIKSIKDFYLVYVALRLCQE